MDPVPHTDPISVLNIRFGAIQIRIGSKANGPDTGVRKQSRPVATSSPSIFPLFSIAVALGSPETSEREESEMTRGKQKIEAQRRNAERNQKPKGSQIEARAVGLKVICPICKVLKSSPPLFLSPFLYAYNVCPWMSSVVLSIKFVWMLMC